MFKGIEEYKVEGEQAKWKEMKRKKVIRKKKMELKMERKLVKKIRKLGTL